MAFPNKRLNINNFPPSGIKLLPDQFRFYKEKLLCNYLEIDYVIYKIKKHCYFAI